MNLSLTLHHCITKSYLRYRMKTFERKLTQIPNILFEDFRSAFAPFLFVVDNGVNTILAVHPGLKTSNL